MKEQLKFVVKAQAARGLEVGGHATAGNFYFQLLGNAISHDFLGTVS